MEVLKSTGRLQKQWLRVSTTHIDLMEAHDSKAPHKSLPLIGVQAERIPPKLSNQHLLELVTSSPKSVVLNIAENCNSWLLVILQLRVLAVKKLFDTCPVFRNFELLHTQHKDKEKKTNREAAGKVRAETQHSFGFDFF